MATVRWTCSVKVSSYQAKVEVSAVARFSMCSWFGPSSLCLHTLKLRRIFYPLVAFSLSLLHMRITLVGFLFFLKRYPQDSLHLDSQATFFVN